MPAQAEKIVFLRHGEKPAEGLGQLDCQGLNRSLALPAVMARLFGRPAIIFAPDPGQKKNDGGAAYAYVRPLATIEPTAITLGMPVQAGIGVDDLGALEAALLRPELANSTVYVAWEHHNLVLVARTVMRTAGGSPLAIPDWPGADFDSLYVIDIAAGSGTFTHLHEGLDGQSRACPS